MSKRICRSDQEWLSLIQECRTSGMPDKAWCEKNGIVVSTFYNAVTRLRKKACDIPEAVKPAYTVDLASRQEVVQIDICPDHSVAEVPHSMRSPAWHLDNSHTIELLINDVQLRIRNEADPLLLEQVFRFVCRPTC